MMLTRRFQPLIGKPGQSSSGNGIKLNESANKVGKLLLRLGCVADAVHSAKIMDQAIVEAFPTSFLGVMLDKDSIPAAGQKSDVFFDHLLGPDSRRPSPPEDNRLVSLVKRFLPDRKLAFDLAGCSDHEQRAGIICAITALCIVSREYVAVGDRTNGYIILPPLAKHGFAGMQPWAVELLRSNQPKGNDAAIIIEPDQGNRQ
jgi:hypothetical protein